MSAPAHTGSALRDLGSPKRLALPPHLRRKRGRPRKQTGPPKPEGLRRGGQPGNRNRWRHGSFSGAARAQREADKALLRRMKFDMQQALAWHACEMSAGAAVREEQG